MPRRVLIQIFLCLSLWLAFTAEVLLSSAATHGRHAAGGKRQSFLERTLILLDVNTRSPVKVLNDNFLSLQVDPSILKNGWLDFLRYPVLTSPIHPPLHILLYRHISSFGCRSSLCFNGVRRKNQHQQSFCLTLAHSRWGQGQNNIWHEAPSLKKSYCIGY